MREGQPLDLRATAVELSQNPQHRFHAACLAEILSGYYKSEVVGSTHDSKVPITAAALCVVALKEGMPEAFGVTTSENIQLRRGAIGLLNRFLANAPKSDQARMIAEEATRAVIREKHATLAAIQVERNLENELEFKVTYPTIWESLIPSVPAAEIALHYLKNIRLGSRSEIVGPQSFTQ